MSRFKLHISHYIIAISGFAHDKPVWKRRQLQIHKGPTIEITIAFPLDPIRRFNVPYPVSRDMLRKLIAREGGILWPKQLKLLHDRIEEFAKYVVDNHGWYRPYRTFVDGFEDRAGEIEPVGAKGEIGDAEADESGKGWF